MRLYLFIDTERTKGSEEPFIVCNIKRRNDK